MECLESKERNEFYQEASRYLMRLCAINTLSTAYLREEFELNSKAPIYGEQ